MDYTLTDIANLAVSACGISKPIQNLDEDQSIEAQMCRTWTDPARRTVLKKIPWSFATKQIQPALVANYPTPEWLYAYQYPSDCLKLTRFMSWRLNNDTRNSRVDYRVMKPTPIALSTATPAPTVENPTTGLWIFTNWPGVNANLPTVLEYTFDNVTVADWPDDFAIATSLKLAELIVATLTTGDPQQKKQQLQQDYAQAISIASLENANEEQRPPEPEAEAIRARMGMEGYGIPGMVWAAQPAGFFVQ